MKDKLNILFKPFLLTLTGLIIGYTLLNWLLFIKLNIFSLKEVVTDFGIPIALTGIAAWLLLRPKLKLLHLEAKRGNWRDFYSFILWVILTIPLIIAQEYIVTTTGKLTALNSIKEINNSPQTKYYAFKKSYIQKQVAGVHSAFEVSGKYNKDFNMQLYVAMPIFENKADTVTSEPLGWLGVKYFKRISNRLEPGEKEAKYREFVQESQRDFDNKNVSAFIYLSRVSNSDDKDGYIEAIKKNPVYKSNETILVGVNEPFEARNGKKLSWLIGSIVVGSLVWLIMLMIPKIDQKELQRIKAGKPDKTILKERKEFIELLKPKDGFFITPILIYINIGVYLLMAIAGLGFVSFKAQDLLNAGANYGPYTKSGEWWRLLTCMFLHGGLMHVLANMYGLLFVGIFLEPLLGRTRYLISYLLTGILASVASIGWYDATVSVGASGAIFGLYGIFLALLLTKVFHPDFAKSFLISISIFVGFNLLMGLAGGIDNAAHIGGLLSGFVIGLVLSPSLKRTGNSGSNISFAPSDALMDEDQFWQIIQTTKNKANGNYEQQQEMLAKELSILTPDEIIQFDNRFRYFRGQANTWELWAAIYIIHGGCGDDSFNYFREWVIGQGKDFYYQTIKDPETLIDVDTALIGETDWEGLGYIPGDVFEELTGEKIPALYQENFETTGEEWNENSDDLKRMFPRLVAKYSDRIKTEGI